MSKRMASQVALEPTNDVAERALGPAVLRRKSSFGSEEFTDNHFHYGYFTASAGILGMSDPQFIADYGPMAKLVAKQYANWDRSDQDFPFLRTFDLWARGRQNQGD